MRNNFQIVKYFSLSEFECKHCGQVIVDRDFVLQLNEFREKLNRPIVLNSAYRCELHNRNVGGAPNSFHRHGRAGDIIAHITRYKVMELYELAKDFGFRGVIAYPKRGIVHVDNRETVRHSVDQT